MYEIEGRPIYVGGCAALALATMTASATPHDKWANGQPVAAWVTKACCGPEDAHHLTPDQVRAAADGWHVAGYSGVIAYGTELPSPDGTYWIFYREFPGGTQTKVYCFFIPVAGM